MECATYGYVITDRNVKKHRSLAIFTGELLIREVQSFENFLGSYRANLDYSILLRDRSLIAELVQESMQAPNTRIDAC